jgi:predicted component of type VI protein secretion system
MKNNKNGLSSTSLTSKPQAWVAVSNNRQKNYGVDNNLVYLDNGQEFQIELFNPTQISYLAKIYLNDNLISTAGLVIKPGQRYFLDRHIDEKKKLLFSTYEVEDTSEVRQAIKSNGKVKVEFYPEMINFNWGNSGTTYVPYNQQWGTITPTINPVTWATSFGGTTTNNVFYTAGNISTTSTLGNNATYTSSNSGSGNGYVTCSVAVSFETGRVDKGEKSQQTFGTDYGNYSGIWTYSSEYQIMPRSVKPVEVAEIRSYCPGCGTRMKKKTWKFCPNCGESLD